MSFSTTTSCRICNTNAVTMLGQFEDIPLNDGAQPELSCVLAKLVIGYCSTCRMVQRIGDKDLSGYYQGSTYSVVSSPFLNNFMNAVANHIVRLCKTMQHAHPPRVLDIGCNTGEQLLAFRQLGCDVIGVEPSTSLATVASSRGLEVHNVAFDSELAAELLREHGLLDVVVSTFTLDQIDDPLGFMRGIRNILRPGVGLVVLEVHDIDVTYQTKEVALFDREHSIYPDRDSLGVLLHLAGLEIIETNFLPEALCRENSLLVVARHTASVETLSTPAPNVRDLSGHQEAFRTITAGIDNLTAFLNDCIDRGLRLAGYGAGFRGIMYCSLIPNGSAFAYFVDGNPALHNSRMPKSQVPVYGPEHIQTDPVDYIVVFSHGYFQEILSTCEALGYPKSALISLPEILTGDVHQVVGINAHDA
jgi:SAM-dependent methyltransferase